MSDVTLITKNYYGSSMIDGTKLYKCLQTSVKALKFFDKGSFYTKSQILKVAEKDPDLDIRLV